MSQSSPEGIILGKGSSLQSFDLSINKEKVISIKSESKTYTEEQLKEAINFIPYHLEHGNIIGRKSDKEIDEFLNQLKNK